MNKVGMKLFNVVNGNKVLRGAVQKAAPLNNKVRLYSPEITLVGGIAAGFAASVLFAKAYKRHTSAVSEIKEEIELANDIITTNNENTDTAFTTEEKANMLMPLYGAYIGTLIRNYAPAALTGGLAVALVLKSHGIMKGRTQGLAAALILTEQGFQEYRKRVAEEIGEDAEDGLYLGAEKRSVTTVTEVDGKKKKNKSTEWIFGQEITPTTYGRVWDQSHREWSPERDWNLMLLRAREKMANDWLMIHGTITLNRIYSILGFDETSYGAIVGWALDGPGDNFVDFGLDRKANLNVSVNTFVLDFNVNGTMFHYM